MSNFLLAEAPKYHTFNKNAWSYVCSHKYFPIKTEEVLDNEKSCIWVHTSFNLNYIQSIKKRSHHLYKKIFNKDTMLFYIENPCQVRQIDYYIELTKNFQCHFCVILPLGHTQILYQSERINIIEFKHTMEGYAIDINHREDLWLDLVNIIKELYTFDIDCY